MRFKNLTNVKVIFIRMSQTPAGRISREQIEDAAAKSGRNVANFCLYHALKAAKAINRKEGKE